MNLCGKHYRIKQHQECVGKNIVEEKKERSHMSCLDKMASSDKFMSQ
jgi:hypothetical protein